jgi:hypothetical protein
VVSGVTYIDECVGPDSSAFYLGVFYTMAILGPALGYSIGGQFLNIHADFLRFFYTYFCPDFIKLTTGLLPRVHAHVLRTPRPFRLFNMQNGALRPPPSRPTHRSFADPSGEINYIYRKPRENPGLVKKENLRY